MNSFSFISFLALFITFTGDVFFFLQDFFSKVFSLIRQFLVVVIQMGDNSNISYITLHYSHTFIAEMEIEHYAIRQSR